MDAAKDAAEQQTINDELWDENIDYVLALRDIVALPNGCTSTAALAQDIAMAVLRKFNKEEE
jgi:hypothetical protein